MWYSHVTWANNLIKPKCTRFLFPFKYLSFSVQNQNTHSIASQQLPFLFSFFSSPLFFVNICCRWKQHGVLHSLFGGTQGDRPSFRASRKPLLCFGILLSVRTGCMLTEARGITPQLSSTRKSPWSRGWPPGRRAPCSMTAPLCVCECKWFILKQDIKVLRIHPQHQPRKLCAQLQHAIHTFYWCYSVKVWCVCVTAWVCVWEIVSAYVCSQTPSLVHYCVLVPFLPAYDMLMFWHPVWLVWSCHCTDRETLTGQSHSRGGCQVDCRGNSGVRYW